MRELERVCDEWQTSFQDIARHTQGIFGIVPMTPAAVSTRLDEQQTQIQTLQAHIQRERREFDEARESFQAVLKMHQDASRRSAKDDISRFNEQVGMVMKKQSEALAEQRDARMKMQAETRQFLEEKDMKDREIESLRAQLSATVRLPHPSLCVRTHLKLISSSPLSRSARPLKIGISRAKQSASTTSSTKPCSAQGPNASPC